MIGRLWASYCYFVDKFLNRGVNMKISKHVENKKNENKKNDGFKFGPVSCQLGDRETAHFMYDCRIMNKETGMQDRVLVFANNFGEVKWCMMGYTKKTFIVLDTSVPYVKHFVYPNDVGQKKFVIIAARGSK